MLSFYQYFYGILGEGSVLSFAFLVHFFGKRLFTRDLIPVSDRSVLLYGIAVAGIILYPTALGLSRWDLYRLGYQPILLLFLLLVTVSTLWFSGRPIAALILLIAVIAHNAGLMESDNLWDYLIDPFVTIYAFIWVGREALLAVRSEKNVYSIGESFKEN